MALPDICISSQSALDEEGRLRHVSQELLGERKLPVTARLTDFYKQMFPQSLEIAKNEGGFILDVGSGLAEILTAHLDSQLGTQVIGLDPGYQDMDSMWQELMNFPSAIMVSGRNYAEVRESAKKTRIAIEKGEALTIPGKIERDKPFPSLPRGVPLGKITAIISSNCLLNGLDYNAGSQEVAEIIGSFIETFPNVKIIQLLPYITKVWPQDPSYTKLTHLIHQNLFEALSQMQLNPVVLPMPGDNRYGILTMYT
jgi:hypothetical protein